jgi:hypothetical protein
MHPDRAILPAAMSRSFFNFLAIILPVGRIANFAAAIEALRLSPARNERAGGSGLPPNEKI